MKGTSRAALALAVLGVVIPKYGILVTAASGVFVIIASGKHSAYARAAVGINFLNVFLLSPLFVLSLFDHDIFLEPVNHALEIYIVVMIILLITLVINLRKEKRRKLRRQRREQSVATTTTPAA